VQEHEVEIRGGSRVSTTHGADSGESHARGIASDLRKVVGEALVNESGEVGAPVAARHSVSIKALCQFPPQMLEVPHPRGVRDLSV
jgi:hypothetical protein